MEWTRDAIALMGLLVSVGIAWGISRGMIDTAINKTLENERDIEFLRVKTDEIESRLTLDDGRSKYITRPECDTSRQEMCARHALLESKLEVIVAAGRADTQKIIDAIREMRN